MNIEIVDFEGMITFTYYKNLLAAVKFYEEIMGLKKVIDVDFAKVYKVTENAHIGIVDSNRGHLKANEEKPVMLTFIVEDIEKWHQYLIKKNVEIIQAPKEATYLRMMTMLFKDPEGYVGEILQWLKKPYGK
jgi:predicted enzyme related to lactoylglutathione lyase